MHFKQQIFVLFVLQPRLVRLFLFFTVFYLFLSLVYLTFNWF